MELVLSIIHVLACLLIIGVILIQSGKGGGLGAGFGGASSAAQQIFGGRGAGNFLTRFTVGLAVTFMATSLALAYLSSRPRSLLDLSEVSGAVSSDEDTIVEEGSGELIILGDQPTGGEAEGLLVQEPPKPEEPMNQVVIPPVPTAEEPGAEGEQPPAAEEPAAEDPAPDTPTDEVPPAEPAAPAEKPAPAVKEAPKPKAEPKAEPKPKNPEPAAKSDEPKAKGEEPKAKGEEPKAKGEEPKAKGEEPKAKSEEPKAQEEAPAAPAEGETAE